MKTVIEILKLSSSYLEERKITPCRRIAEELLSHVLHLKRIDLYLQYDRPVEPSELTKLREFVQRAGKGEPVEYILGEILFRDCLLRIDKRVLIPRPETELLVEEILKDLQGSTLWDICTGSGCIGIALKKIRPELSVSLSDISSDALALAEENARLNGTEVCLLQGDLLHPFQGKQADLIVCNPPYIATTEYPSLQLLFEPKQAFLAGEDGLLFYRRLAQEAPLFLRSGGRLYLEIGSTQGASVKKIFHLPSWKNPKLFKDWSGKDRFFSLEKT